MCLEEGIFIPHVVLPALSFRYGDDFESREYRGGSAASQDRWSAFITSHDQTSVCFFIHQDKSSAQIFFLVINVHAMCHVNFFFRSLSVSTFFRE